MFYFYYSILLLLLFFILFYFYFYFLFYFFYFLIILFSLEYNPMGRFQRDQYGRFFLWYNSSVCLDLDP